MRVRRLFVSLALLGALSGCALTQPKTIEFESVPSDATISVDGQYYGEGVASYTTTPGLPRTLHLRIESPSRAPYEVDISNKGDYSLWWFTALYGVLGAGSIAVWTQTHSDPAAALGATFLVLAPIPLLFNHKFEDGYTLDAEHKRVVENPKPHREADRQAVLTALQSLPTLRDVYVQIDEHYLRRVADDRLAHGAIEGLLRVAGHADQLAKFAGRQGATPFEGLTAAYQELGLSPYDRRLEYGAILGMVDALNDPLATYYLPPGSVPRPKPSHAPSPKADGPIKVASPGLLFDYAKPGLTVKAVISGSPAWKAGLRPGDQVIGMDGEPTAHIRNEIVAGWLRRRSGEDLTLEVRRNHTETLTRTMKLVAIDRPPVQVEEWSGDTVYIRLNEMSDAYVPLFTELLHFADSKNPLIDLGKKNLVLDLRGPDSGNFAAVAKIAALLTTDKRFGKIVGRHGRDLFDGSACMLPRKRKLVALVDGSTSGGHEILAGILQDQHRAVLVGTPTYGFCYSYISKDYPDGSSLVVPSGEVLTPAKRRLSREGVQPNVVVPQAVFDPAEDAEDPLRGQARALLLEDLDAWKLEEKYRLPSPEASSSPETSGH